MKSLLLVLVTMVSMSAFAAKNNVSLNCEEDVGSGDYARAIAKLEGNIQITSGKRELSLQEKNALSLDIFTALGGTEKVASADFTAVLVNEAFKLPAIEIKLLKGDKYNYTYRIVNAGGPGEHLISVIGHGILGDKILDTGSCFGSFPVQVDL